LFITWGQPNGWNFVKTRSAYVVNVDFEAKKGKKFARYNRTFVIAEFVITEFECISAKGLI
jgi:hypothetical protein